MLRRFWLVLLTLVLLLASSCSSSEIEGISADEISEQAQDSSYVMNVADSDNVAVSGDFEYVVENGYVKITGCLDYGKSIIIPAEINGLQVKVLGSESFYQHKEMVSVQLPDGLTTIEGAPFYRCYSLKKIYIPATVNEICDEAFFRCSSLTEISVDSKNEYYVSVDGVLYNKDMTVLVGYPEGREAENFVIPDSVKSVEGAFGYHCKYLRKITMSSNLTNLPSYNMFVFPDDITLVVEKGSIAEKYAKDNELKYEYIEPKE